MLFTSRSVCVLIPRLYVNVFVQEGCEFLIATDATGRLDLRDIYVHDSDLDIFARPEFVGDMPDVPAHYVQVPWRVEFSGDTLYRKPAWQRVSAVSLLS
jgi:hypothetical protein